MKKRGPATTAERGGEMVTKSGRELWEGHQSEEERRQEPT
jgi:hypothetical protein